MADKSKADIWKIFKKGSLYVIASWILSALLILWVFPKPDEHGTFGDLFGAINALFSGMGFLGLIVTVLLQKEALEEQRAEIKVARDSQAVTEKQVAEQMKQTRFINRLEALNHLINSLDRKIDKLRGETHISKVQVRESLVAQQDKYLSELEAVYKEYHSSEERIQSVS